MAVSTVSNAWLDWTGRLNDQKVFINQAFERLTKSTKSAWDTFNGLSFYGLWGVNEHAIIKKIIVQSYPKQKEFYVLDLAQGEWPSFLEFEGYITTHHNKEKFAQMNFSEVVKHRFAYGV